MAPIALEITIHRFYSPAAVALTCRALLEETAPALWRVLFCRVMSAAFFSRPIR
jgi:hypothetical protein